MAQARASFGRLPRRTGASLASLTAGPTGGATMHGLARELFGGSGDRTLVLLRAAWPAAVGPELARRTEVVALETGTLRVRVPDAGWRKILHQMRGDILARLARVAGGLAPRRLGFVEGPGPASPTRPLTTTAPPPQPPRPDPEARTVPPSELRAAAQEIPDPLLRQRFLESASRYLGRSGRP